MPGNLRTLQGRQVEPTRILKFPDLWGKEYAACLSGLITPCSFGGAWISQLPNIRAFGARLTISSNFLRTPPKKFRHFRAYLRVSEVVVNPRKATLPERDFEHFRKIGPFGRGLRFSDVV